jgi:hypothetical protein
MRRLLLTSNITHAIVQCAIRRWRLLFLGPATFLPLFSHKSQQFALLHFSDIPSQAVIRSPRSASSRFFCNGRALFCSPHGANSYRFQRLAHSLHQNCGVGTSSLFDSRFRIIRLRILPLGRAYTSGSAPSVCIDYTLFENVAVFPSPSSRISQTRSDIACGALLALLSQCSRSRTGGLRGTKRFS